MRSVIIIIIGKVSVNIWKELTLSYFVVLYQDLHGRTKQSNEIFYKNNEFLDPYSPGNPLYDTGVLITAHLFISIL